MTRALAVMAKYWQPGHVKTRLAVRLGAAPAARLYRSMLETTLSRLGGIAERNTLAFSPADRRAEFERIAPPRWQLEPQSDGDLGERMSHQLASALAAAAQRVVLIGSDSPTLPREYIARAFDMLADVEVVLGPTDDGGYYLVGAAGGVPDIFTRMPWSSDAVWPETLCRLDRAGSAYAVLPPWYDIDDETGLDRLKKELAAGASDDVEFSGLCECFREITGTPPDD